MLWLAAGLSLAVGNRTVAIAVLLVILLNATFAFVQELQAERAVEALAGYLPQHAIAIRDGEPTTVEAAELVPGDIVLIAEGDRVPADMRLLTGAVEVDLSTLTGKSVPVLRSAELVDQGRPRLEARDLVFSGIGCTGGEGRGVQQRDGTWRRGAHRRSHRGGGLVLAPFPLIVWGADELRRYLVRRRAIP